MTETERKEIADELCDRVRMLVMDPDAAVDVIFRAGVERRPNLRTGYYEHQYNGTHTMEIRINGGAEDTEGDPVTAEGRDP